MKKFSLSVHGFLLLFALYNTSAQNNGSLLDSSYQYFKDRIDETMRFDSISAKFYIDTYIKKAIREKDTLQALYGYELENDLLKNDTIHLRRLDSLIKISGIQPTADFPAYAYRYKARFYGIRGNNDLAVKYFLTGIEYCKKYKNVDLELFLKNRIALLYRRNGDYKKAKEISLELFGQYKKYPHLINTNKHLYTLLAVSRNYVLLKEYDSAAYYNRFTYAGSVETNNNVTLQYAIFIKGQIEYYKKNYAIAADSIVKVIPEFEKWADYLDLSLAYSYVAISYQKLNNIPGFLTYSEKLDAVSKKKEAIHELHREHYYLLKQHYKKENDLKNHLKYINRFIYIDSILDEKKNSLTHSIFENLSKPELLKEKQLVIKELEKNLSYSNTVRYSLYGITGLALLFIAFQYRRRIRMKKRFEEIIQSNKETIKRELPDIEKQGDLNIQKEVVESVLKGLEAFERNCEFVNPELSLQLLAYDLNTNANYLSKIVNHYRGVGFSKYINDLRIDHAVRLLESNSKVRKYSIKGIAYEMGYKSPKYFSSLFYKKTGLKPSYYITQLEKVN